VFGSPDSIPADELLSSARARDPSAMTQLAARLLVGREAPLDPSGAMELLRSACELGWPQAMEIMATLAAAGAWTAQSWDVALDLLQTSAERGWERARAQLAILGADRELAQAARLGAASDRVWRELREGVDAKVWLIAPERRSFSEAPRIRAVSGFATPDVCDWLIATARKDLRPSMMFDGQRSSFQHTRTCSDYVFDITAAGLVMILLREKISAATRLPIAAMEPPQVFHYAVGQEFKPHYDFLYDGKSGYGRDGDYHGDRIATFLLYLNDDYEGGELEFPHIGLRHRGRRGDAVYFANVDSEGRRERLSLHAGLPITRGEKFILSQWIHDRPFTANV
jgi:hypothetical protein